MPQTPEAQSFLARLSQLPPGAGATDLLSQALQPSLDDEAQLRKLWATDKTHERLRDPYVGLVDVFDAPDDIRKTRARVVSDETDLSAHHILALDEKRRRKDGEPSMVPSLDDFKKNWALFTEGSLSQLMDWSNVVAAGGAVQACLAPLPEYAKASKRAMRKYFHNNAFPTSDVDLFLYGLTPEQAEVKMQTIYEAVRDSVPWDVTCVRTKHTVSIHSQYPYRSVQIVLRLYSSPAEILAGFDVDAPCCAFDGQRVWANPRAIVAMMRQCNTVDMTRRSPSYEVRLTKYSMRNFEVYVPSLRRDDIDPTIFERSIQRIEGLARLLVLERMIDQETREQYLVDRRKLRNRPNAKSDHSRRKTRKLKSDLKGAVDFGGLEMNDYDVVSLHIPYGTGWDARRIDRLVYKTDLGMNSPFNPKNKGRRLHRHPAFFGTLSECIEDCCEFCPEPKDEEEKELQDKEDSLYVRGRIQFLQDDPGRQSMSGSFHPIDDGEWAEQAYMGPTEKLFNAIALSDRAVVASVISQVGFDIDRRDHVGRTPLQIAILSKEADIACDLIEAGARMTARLVDGRTALHLAAQLDLPVVVRKLLERSAVNDEKAKVEEAAKREKQKKEHQEDKMEVDDDEGDDDNGDDEDDEHDEDEERGSSDDDWSSEDREKREKKADKTGHEGQFPEDEKDEPDVFDVNLPDWDYSLTPLQYAVMFGSLGAIDELLAGGADATLMTHRGDGFTMSMHPLTLTSVTRNTDVAIEVIKKLVAAGATSSQADNDLFTIFHRIVCVGGPAIVETLLAHDANARAVLNSPHVANDGTMTLPLVSAIGANRLGSLAVLLAFGAKTTFTDEDSSLARALDHSLRKTQGFVYLSSGVVEWRNFIHWPVEASIANFSDAVHLLVNIGADYNVGLRQTRRMATGSRKTILDAVRDMIIAAKRDLEKSEDNTKAYNRDMFSPLAAMSGWKATLGQHVLSLLDSSSEEDDVTTYMNMNNLQSIEYHTKVEELLLSHGAKTWKELHPDDSDFVPAGHPFAYFHSAMYGRPRHCASLGFYTMDGWASMPVPSHLESSYEELFQACCDGDNAKIESMCLPQDANPEKTLLQITVRYGVDEWRRSPTEVAFHPTPAYVTGTTALALAVGSRHWTTARLILAITVAQQSPFERQLAADSFTVKGINLDSDDEDDHSDDSEDMEDSDDRPDGINFIDMARRSSIIQVGVSPERLLQEEYRFRDPKTGKVIAGTLLYKAILENDFEVFVQIADLYQSLLDPLELPSDVIQWTLLYDRPLMLDEFLRRTGAGIELPDETQDEDDATTENEKAKKKPLPKTYLGLNVHGKKRKDLARKGDPNAPPMYKPHEFPLLWRAAREGAVECVRYLSTERSIGAFQYYASTHNDERAQYLKRIDGQLSEHLGWSINPLNESIITAAVVGDKLELLKVVIDLQPAQLQNALMARIHYAGFNHILVAAAWGCSSDMFDYLLSKGVSVTETDCRGWNVIHLLCVGNGLRHFKLLRHILQKLPKDVIDRMLVQQSKKAYNTPLHLAVKKGCESAVRLLLQAKVTTFLARDCNGSTALHLAASKSLHKITRLLSEAGPEALELENGVGMTALEIALSKWVDDATTRAAAGTVPYIGCIQPEGHMWHPSPFHRRQATMADDVKELKDTVDRLLAQGRLREGTKLAAELVAFTNKLESDVKACADVDTKEAEDDVDNVLRTETNVKKTVDCLLAALASRTGTRRQLVHLLDVHRSVNGSLDRSQGRANPAANSLYNRKDEDDGLEPEAKNDKEEEVKRHSAVATWFANSVGYNAGFTVFGDDPL